MDDKLKAFWKVVKFKSKLYSMKTELAVLKFFVLCRELNKAFDDVFFKLCSLIEQTIYYLRDIFRVSFVDFFLPIFRSRKVLTIMRFDNMYDVEQCFRDSQKRLVMMQKALDALNERILVYLSPASAILLTVVVMILMLLFVAAVNKVYFYFEEKKKKKRKK